jgi:hypothetical protein
MKQRESFYGGSAVWEGKMEHFDHGSLIAPV